MSNFFVSHRPSFRLIPQVPGQKGFRICQLGAIWAVKSHFTASGERALVNLPTGAGKTAVMMALAFELGARRVFILTPSILVREQTVEHFRSLKQLLADIGALPRTFKPRPEVKEIKTELTTNKHWNDLLDFDVVVATPGTIRVTPPPERIFGSEKAAAEFDLVFVDEAHHSPAETWTEFLNRIGPSRTLLFTATPFRRDRKRIRAKLIYVYPISKAIADGVYRPVQFVAVHELDQDRRDAQLAEECRRQFVQARKQNPSTATIIKATGIGHAHKLLKVYQQVGFTKLGLIHSRLAMEENRAVLSKVLNNKGDEGDPNQLEGFVCVDMGSEGIDVPTLRIAVFHDTPRTLPYTIQIVGRVTRTDPSRKGKAVLIADPGLTIGTEVEELYSSDQGWSELLPGLFEQLIKKSKYLPTPGSVLAGVGLVPADDLNPYLTVKIYQQSPRAVSKKTPLNVTAEDLQLERREVEIEVFDKRDKLLVVITRSWEVPRWTANRAFETQQFDLHIYCHIRSLIFECTTSPTIARWIRSAAIDENVFHPAGYEIIRNGLSDAVGGHYFMLGMVKQSGAGNNTPQCKILMGEDVQQAVKYADGRSFTAGHAMMTNGHSTRGIAIQSSRIWSNARISLVDFQHWCESLEQLIVQPSKPIPLVDNKLMEAARITKYPDDVDVISILFDATFWRAHAVKISVAGQVLNNPICVFSDLRLDRAQGAIFAELSIAEQNAGQRVCLKIEHHLESPYWRVVPPVEVIVEVDSGGHTPYYNGPLIEYLKDFPPIIVLSSGATIRDEILFRPKIQNQRLDFDVIEAKDWADTDITKEADPPGPGFQWNVQERTVNIIRDEYNLGSDDFLICDDRANEVADFVLIQGGLRHKIAFFHCKYKKVSKKKNGKQQTDKKPPIAGLSREDITELTDQGVRTGHWIRTPNLLERLLGRIAGISKLVHGDINDLKVLASKFAPDEWTYAVTLVQPGLSRSKLVKAAAPSQAEQLLVVLWDRIATEYDATFLVWANA